MRVLKGLWQTLRKNIYRIVTVYKEKYYAGKVIFEHLYEG